MSGGELFVLCVCGAEIKPCGDEPPLCRAWVHVATGSPHCHPREIFARPRDGSRDSRERAA